MANPQLDHDPDDGEEPECLRQTQSRRAQPLSRRYLWSEIDEVETNDLRVATPVADSDTYQKVQHRPRRAYTKTDMGIDMLPEQAVDWEYETPPRRCQARLPESASLSKCGNSNSPSITPRRLAKDTTRNDSLPNPAPRSESNMMQQPEIQSITHEQLVAEVKGIYAGLVLVETKCIEVDNAQSTEGRITPEEWHHFIALQRKLMLGNSAVLNLSSPKTPHNHELGALLSEVSLRSRSFCRLSSRLQPLLQTAKGSPSCVRFVEFFQLISALSDILSKYSDLEPEKFKAPVPTFSPAPAAYDFLGNSGPAYYELGLQSVIMPEPSTTGFDQHLAIDSFLFNDDGVTIDPIYSVQAAPQDPDFLSLDVLQRTSIGIAETPVKEDLTGALPAAVAPDPILQTYGEPDRQEPFNPVVNVASAGQGVQNTGGQKRTSYFTCPKCQQIFATSFTLGRHQTEAHKEAAPSPEELFSCPNRGCKRSGGGSPFKRLYNLNRHLRVCKHNPNVSTSSAESGGMEERSLSHPISTPALPDELQPAEPLSEGSSAESSVRKRSRSEKDDDWSEESLLREMKKKLKRMAQEVKEKEDAYLQAREGLKSIQKTIQVMEDSLRKS
ncbi:hypothetical protein FMEXI_3557 [Fusarium mexicanum]|uniref:C2H2-type domain-containing protein n=1 Tax=Fusarium mexicanum TaxID=751941 RepID=A0A8H5J9P7_9HYPO|nr:hypothetical protein FMEXI_3557 [Fusarium mexicanum]